RRPLVRALLERERPTVLCTQEGRFRQLRELRADLDGYDWIHLGRGGGSRGESTAILWDERRLAPLEYDHLWGSRRPDTVASRSGGSGTGGMYSWVDCAAGEAGRGNPWVNAHRAPRSGRARRNGARLNAEIVSRFRSPVIVAGDFNCPPASPAHRTLTRIGL